MGLDIQENKPEQSGSPLGSLWQLIAAEALIRCDTNIAHNRAPSRIHPIMVQAMPQPILIHCRTSLSQII